MKKFLGAVICLIVSLFLSSCYNSGFEDGYDEGYGDGWVNGSNYAVVEELDLFLRDPNLNWKYWYWGEDFNVNRDHKEFWYFHEESSAYINSTGGKTYGKFITMDLGYGLFYIGTFGGETKNTITGKTTEDIDLKQTRRNLYNDWFAFQTTLKTKHQFSNADLDNLDDITELFKNYIDDDRQY